MGIGAVTVINLKTFWAHKWQFALIWVGMLLLGMVVGIHTQRLLSSEGLLAPSHVALVDLDHSLETSLIMSAIGDATEYEGLVYFIAMTEADAHAALVAGEIVAMVVFPVGFGHEMTTGGNLPFEVSYNLSQPFESAVIRLVADAFAEMLKSSQIGVYTVLNYAWGAVETGALTQAQYESIFWQVNFYFIEMVLGRHALFEVQTVYATGVPPVWHYGTVAYLVVLLWLSVRMAHLARDNMTAHNLRLLKASGVTFWQVWLGTVGAMLAVLVGTSLAVWAGLLWWRLLPVMPVIGVALGISMIGGVTTFVFERRASRGLFSAVACGVGLVMAGGVVPMAFLPAAIQGLAPFNPLYWAIWLLQASLF